MKKEKKVKENKVSLKEQFSSRASKAGGFSIAVMAIVLVLVVVANLAVAALPEKYTQFDLTDMGLYSIGEQSKELLAGLKQDITIYYVCQKGNEDNNIRYLLQDYAENSEHITLTTVDPAVSPALVKKYTEADLDDNSAIVVCGEQSKVVYNTDMVEYDYSNYYTTGQSSVSGYTTENAIANAIDFVTSNDVPVVRFLTGHGEAELESYFYSYLEDSNFNHETLDLLTAGKIPDDTSCVAVISPDKDFSEGDTAMFKEYMEKGGKIFFVSDDMNKKDYPNLYALLGEYGITPAEGIAVETDTSRSAQTFILAVQGDHEILEDLNGYNLLVHNDQGFTLAEDSEASGLISTTEDAYATTDTENLKPLNKERETLYFGAAVPVGEGAMVYYSTDTFMDSDCIQQSYYANIGLFVNSFSWLCGKENSISIPATQMTAATLTVSDSAASMLKVVIVFLLPAAFLVTGGVILVRRKKH